ncbi:MAG: ribonuclease HII, partial [Luteococcus japonicus]
ILADTPARRVRGLADSKLLTARARERVYDEVMAKAVSVAWVRVEPDECDQLGMHEADIQGLRRALLRLDQPASYVLTDGFPVDGLGVPGLAVWKGDRVAACVAAASVVAKVTRDRIMRGYADTYPNYAFEVHKGYVTKLHQQRLEEFGPCDIHRFSYANVARAKVVAP